MSFSRRQERIAIIGFGAIGRRVYRALLGTLPDTPLSILVRTNADVVSASVGSALVFEHIDQLLSWRPTLVVECASHNAVATIAPAVLAAGADVILASIGALANEDLQESLRAAGKLRGARLIVVSGGIGGLDALNAARLGGLNSVTYVGRKRPAAWRSTPAESQFDLKAIESPTTIFSGNAFDAARLYPKNANVTASVALAGIGFKRTSVELVADPGVIQNVHEVQATGAFGSLSIVVENNPLPENPKTSMLAALSIEAEVRKRAVSMPF